jgi:hypothetical protein
VPSSVFSPATPSPTYPAAPSDLADSRNSDIASTQDVDRMDMLRANRRARKKKQRHVKIDADRKTMTAKTAVNNGDEQRPKKIDADNKNAKTAVKNGNPVRPRRNAGKGEQECLQFQFQPMRNADNVVAVQPADQCVYLEDGSIAVPCLFYSTEPLDGPVVVPNAGTA